MAIVKLVCQGCGANLDAHDDQRIIECVYCSTTNKLNAPAAPAPAPAPRTPPVGHSHYAPQVSPYASTSSGSGAGRAVAIIVVLAVVLPLVLGGFIAYKVMKSAGSTIESTLAEINGVTQRALDGIPKMGQLIWASERPFLVDVDGDGNQEIIGLAQSLGSTQLELTAVSGESYASLWSTTIGERSDLPQTRLLVAAEQQLALVPLGASIHAYELGTGKQRWVASLPDKVEELSISAQGLWVTCVDESLSQVAFANGKVSAAEPTAAADTKPMRDDDGYELIVPHENLDLDHDQFDKLRVEQAFCSDEALVVPERRGDASCRLPNGLAFATRAKGSKVPFLLGYDPGDKSERWRVQLTKPGSLETVDGGFMQPRAEFIGDDEAIVSFAPEKSEGATIRRVSLATGETQWEAKLAGETVSHLNGMVVGESVVLVNLGQSIKVLSLADGIERAALGGL